MAENMSFLPEDYLEKKIARRTNVIFVGLFAVVLMAVLASDFVGRRQGAKLHSELGAKNNQFEEMRRQFEQIEALNAEKQRMRQMASVTTTLKDSVLKSMVFAELINAMPATLKLTDLDLETKAIKNAATQPRTAMQREKQRQKTTVAAAEEVKITATRVEMALVGLAPTDVEISDYIAALNAHALFRDVTLQYVEESKNEQTASRKFRIELALNPAFDAVAFEPTRSSRQLLVDPMGDTIQINTDGQMIKPTETLGSVETE